MTDAEKKRIDEQGLKWNHTVRELVKELQSLQKEYKCTYLTDVRPDLQIIHYPNPEVCRWAE